jgi:hypothetical protein
MSITYKGILGNKAAVTLPSVEGWGTNNNILRDPPKSIMTRRIDKVNQDGSLNEMLYNSGDRFAENINVYARGVNPMVSVEYGNNTSFQATNQANKNGQGSFYGGGKLPYRVMQGGAFRPPLLRQEQLLPLSRQPRNITFVATNKERIDYAKSALCEQQPKCHRQINKDKIEGFIAPTKTMKIDAPLKEFFTDNYVNDETLQYAFSTNLHATGDTTPLYVEEKKLEKNYPTYQAMASKSANFISATIQPDNEIILETNTPIHTVQAPRNINISVNNGILDENSLELDKNLPQYQVRDVKSQNISVTNGVLDQNSLELDKNLPQYQVRDVKSQNISVTNGVLDQNSLELDKNLPQYQVRDVKSQNISVTNGVLDQNSLELEKNIPSHMLVNSKNYNSGERGILNEQILLDENTPHYALQPNKSDKRIQFQNKYDVTPIFDLKLPSTMVQSPKSQKSLVADASSKDFARLPASMQLGSYSGKVGIPTSERNLTYNSNYSTNKRDIAKKIMSQRT